MEVVHYSNRAVYKYLELNQVSVWSGIKEANTNEKVTETAHEFLLAGTFCALAADSKLSDTVWFMKIEEEEEGRGPATDDYGIKILDGCKYLQGKFLEKVTKSNKKLTFKLMKRTTYFYPESIVYPFVNFYEENGNYIIANTDFCEILTLCRTFWNVNIKHFTFVVITFW